MSTENKVTMTRVIIGVASVGATLAFVYLYNKYQERKNKDDNAPTSSSGSRMRRQSTKSGEVKKVTFKTTEAEEEKDRESRLVHASPAPKNSKSLLLRNEHLNTDKPPAASAVATHDATKKSDNQERGSKNVDEGRARSSGPSAEDPRSTPGNTSSDDVNASCDPTTNHYENNSTLKLEDSKMSSTNNTMTPSPAVVVTTDAVVEEVITRSAPDGPLMTSTPLPGKDPSGQVPLRKAAAMFEAHTSDLQPSARVDDGTTQGVPTSSITPETDYDTFAFRKEMRIPREIVPGLIGKKGCNIKSIQGQSSTSINFHDETLENGDRLCVIRGAPGNVSLAESLIEKFMYEQPTVFTITLTVPLSSVGRIIGRGGETIRSIQDQSKARVNVESHNHYGSGDSGPTRSIIIRGTEDQINLAKQLIMEKVDEERNLRKNIDVATASRTPRRGGGHSPSSTPLVGPSVPPGNIGSAELALPIKQDGILEVFVSCVYHPNDFWIQVVGRDSIELDKLCDTMTDYYHAHPNDRSEPQFNVGDIVAAPFEVDGKIYRAKVMRIDDNGVEVSYLDYGDRRVLPISEVHELHPNFLGLRFQAIQATLNLGCISDKWEDEVINEFCDLTYCAQWQSLTAKVKDYLKDVEDGHDVIWIELLDKQINIGEELVRKRLATPKGPSGSGCNGAQRKSYAAATLGGTTSTPSQPVVSAADPTLQESLENERNGN